MNFAFPKEFSAAKEELARFCSAQISHSALISSEVDILRAKKRIQGGFVPFMTIEEASWPDIYAFDFSTTPPAVVVWSDHAIVQRWESFDAFLNWTRDWVRATDAKKG